MNEKWPLLMRLEPSIQCVKPSAGIEIDSFVLVNIVIGSHTCRQGIDTFDCSCTRLLCIGNAIGIHNSGDQCLEAERARGIGASIGVS